MNADLMEYIYAHWSDYLSPPTIRDLCDRSGIPSTSVVSKHLKQLEAAGLILPRKKNQRRAIIPSNIRITFE